MAKRKLNISVVVSGYMHELIVRLHNEYPHRERSGIGRIQKMAGHYELTDIRFPEQTNSSGETEMSDKGIEKLLEDIFNEHPEQLGERRCRVHSHHTMGVFRSGTDAAAKAGFNDGQQDHRWSIVTAYTTAGVVTYKCALNVFKPIKVEFDVPVHGEGFDMQEYLKSQMEDYETYAKAQKQLNIERDKQLSKYSGKYVPTEVEISQLINIFNVEDNADNRKECIDLLLKHNKNKYDTIVNEIKEKFEEEAEALVQAFGGDLFSSKLNELSEAITKPVAYPQYSYQVPSLYPRDSYNGYPMAGKRDKPLFDADTKYNNHTQKKSFSSLRGYSYGDDYPDIARGD